MQQLVERLARQMASRVDVELRIEETQQQLLRQIQVEPQASLPAQGPSTRTRRKGITGGAMPSSPEAREYLSRFLIYRRLSANPIPQLCSCGVVGRDLGW